MTEDPRAEWVHPPIVLIDHAEMSSFAGGTIRITCAAFFDRSEEDGESCLSGFLVLTPTGALQLYTQLHQALTQLDKQGFIQLPRGKPQA